MPDPGRQYPLDPLHYGIQDGSGNGTTERGGPTVGNSDDVSIDWERRNADRNGNGSKASVPAAADTDVVTQPVSQPVAQCDHCAAILRDGRWEWPKGQRGAIPLRTCPACARIADNRPAAHVCLKGRFVMQNAVAFESIVHYVEAAGMGRHPMERTISLTRQPEAITVTTTAVRLALRIAEAIDAAYNGQIELTCAAPDGYLAITWSR